MLKVSTEVGFSAEPKEVRRLDDRVQGEGGKRRPEWLAGTSAWSTPHGGPAEEFVFI